MDILLFLLLLLSIILFLIGLIRPSLIKMGSRKKVLKFGSATIVILFILFVIVIPEATDEELAEIEKREQVKAEEKLAKQEEKEKEKKEKEKQKAKEEEEAKEKEEQEAKEKEAKEKEEQEKKEKEAEKERVKAKKAKAEVAKKKQKEKELEEKKNRPENIVETAVKKAFGDDSVDKINYNEDNHFVLIRVFGNDNLTKNMTKKSMWIDTKEVLEELDGMDGIDTVDFNILFPLVDQYGNTADDIVMKLSFDKKTRDKINWDNFLQDNIPKISDNYWEHPALSK